MQIVSTQKIKDVVQTLQDGGVVAYPTETVYGLGCDPRDSKAVRRIFRIKGRDAQKNVLLVSSSMAQVQRVAVLRGTALQLARQYWPGPLTLVLPARLDAGLSSGVLSARKEVAVRVSSYPFVRKLCRSFGFPVVSTSANRSGETPCRSGRESVELFTADSANLRPDIFVDGGLLPRSKSSTVVRVSTDGRIEILREGAIKL